MAVPAAAEQPKYSGLAADPTIRSEKSKRLWSLRSIRLQMVVLMTMVFLVSIWLRSNFGMAMVCMVKRKQQSANFSSSSANSSSSYLDKYYNTDVQAEWDSYQISVIHTSLSVGLLLPVFLAQWVTVRFGPKAVIGFGLLTSTIFISIVPVIVYLAPHFLFIVAIRFVLGLAQGCFIPCVSHMLTCWFPVSERSTAMAILTSANQLGTAIAMYSTAALCKVPVLGGWPTSFFLIGIVAFLTFLLWQGFVESSPEKSDRVSPEELAHIRGYSNDHPFEIGHNKGTKTIASAKVSHNTPYLKLIFSPTTFSISVTNFAHHFLSTTIVSYLPEFYRSALGFSLTSNGLWSSVPFVVQLTSKIFVACFADEMKQRGFRGNFVAKLFNNIASFGSALAMLGIAFSSNSTVIILCLCGGLALISGYIPGYMTSIVNVAPAHTAAVSAYCQFACQMAGIIAPLIIGMVTSATSVESGFQSSWSIVFFILAGIQLTSGILYQLFGSEEEDNEEEEENEKIGLENLETDKKA